MKRLVVIIFMLFAFTNGAYALPACVGSWSTNWTNCQGTYTTADGEKYVGEFKNGKYDGQGTYTFANGNKYVGEWKDSKRNGYFTATYTSGDKYVGEIKGDKRTGQGTYTFADGENYVGEWKNDKYDGQGTFTFANGTIREGIWKDDKFQYAQKKSMPACVGSWSTNWTNCQGTYTFGPNTQWAGDKYVGEHKDGKMHGQGTYTYASGDKYVGEYKDDKMYGQGIYTWAGGAIYVGEWKDDKRNGQGTSTLRNGDKYVGEYKDGFRNGQGAYTYDNGTIKEGIWKDNKFQNSRTEIEAIRLAKEEELQRAIKEKEKMAEIEETKKRAELYKKEAPALIEDVREYVNSGEQFDIDLARYIQPVNGISSGEWSDDLVANYENLVAYVNKFEKFKKFRQDKALKREQIRGKLRADLKSDIQRVLVEIENWITGNPLAKESADLLNALDQFAQKPKTNEIKNLEENLAALLQKIEQSGVELPITELLNRRGYSLDGKNDPLAVANVITTLIDAQQYIKDVKAFIEENPTVFGYKVIVFYNNVRPIIENNSWTDEDKSNFSSFEEFSSKENLFVIYRKDAINTRAKGQQIALQRLRSSLVQLLADGSVYLQNNTFADNSLKVYELLEYGRSFERNTNPQDLLRAIEKLKLDFEEYQVPFVDTLISIEFLEMSDEEIILLDKMNEKTKLRNEKFDVLTVKIQEEQDLEKDALLKADVAKAEAARIKAEEEEKKASAELAKTKRKTQDETTTYVNLSDQYREEARTLITDAREYVRQGNQFSLEFVFLNADVEGFAQNEWDQIIFRKYEVFRKYVLGFESFKEFRAVQITSRKEELEAKRRLFEGEVKLSLESLRKWVLSNVLHPNAAIVLTTFNEISDYQKNLKDQLMEMDVLEEELSKLSKSLMDLKINGIYIPGVENIAVAEVDVTGVDKPKLFNLSDAKDLISDIEMYFNQGIGEFDNRFILLYGKSRGVGEDLWNASIEDAVLELKAYVLSFEQFSIFYQKQLEARREAITGQLTSLADDTVYSFELLFDWVRKNPFDVRAPELMLKLQAAQGIIDKLKINPLGSNFEDLNPLNMDLSESLAEFGIALPSKVEPKGGPLDSGLKPLTGSGEPREGRSPTSKFIYVNLSGSARNAFRNIDGGIKFENDTGGYCYEMVEPLSKIERFYTNIALQKSNIPNIGVPERCSDANISSIDLLITDGLALNEGNNLVQSAIASGFEELYQISRNDLDAAILKDDLISDNLKSDILDEVRAGYGYIVFDNNSNVGCLTVAENLDAHNYFIQETSERVLLSRKSLINTYENMSLENAFKQVQRERCGMIYSSAQHLQKLIKGLDNAKTSYNLAPEWYSSKDIRNKQEELDNDEKTNSQDKLLKQREYEEQKELEALANEQARAEAQAIQVGLRIQYGPRLKGLQSEFDTSIMNLVDGLFMGKSVTGLFSGEFGFLDRNVRSDIKKSWEEDSRELQLVDYGTGQWSGRRVEVLVSKLDIRMKNKILGKYKDLCFELMYVWDEEFGVIRDPMATKCADGMLEQWLNKQGFESLWVRN
jgi:hypothetical protein